MAKKALRVTKLGMGTKHASKEATLPPPSFSCPAPRVPAFEPFDAEAVAPPPSLGPSASGIRRSANKRVPRAVVDEVDRDWLSLEPRDAFVLSRIDGALTVEELADLVEMPRDDLDAALARLVALEAIVLD